MNIDSATLEKTRVDHGGLRRRQGVSGKYGLYLPNGRSVVPEIYSAIDAFGKCEGGVEGWQTYDSNGQPGLIITKKYLIDHADMVTRQHLLATFSLSPIPSSHA